MARVLISTPMLEGCLDALSGHELVEGGPGSDREAVALDLCAPTQPVGAEALDAMPRAACDRGRRGGLRRGRHRGCRRHGASGC